MTQRSVELCSGPGRAGGVSFGCVVLDECLGWEREKEQGTPTYAILAQMLLYTATKALLFFFRFY